METRSDTSLRKELDELRELFKQAKEQAQPAQEQAKIAQDLAQRQSELDKAKIDDLELALRVAPLPAITNVSSTKHQSYVSNHWSSPDRRA